MRSSGAASRFTGVPKRAADPPYVTGLLWLFVAIVAYPYMPGSDTEAFGRERVSGLMITPDRGHHEPWRAAS